MEGETELLEAAFHAWLPFPQSAQGQSRATMCPSKIQMSFNAENRHRNKWIVSLTKMGSEPCHRNSVQRQIPTKHNILYIMM